MIIIAEQGCRTQPHRVGPGAASVHAIAQRSDEAPRAFAARVLEGLRDAEDGGLIVYAGGTRYDREVQSARTRVLSELVRRGVATGAAIGVDATGVKGPSRHSLVALVDAFSLVGPREGVMLLDRGTVHRDATVPTRRSVEVRSIQVEGAQSASRVVPSRTPRRVAAA